MVAAIVLVFNTWLELLKNCQWSRRGMIFLRGGLDKKVEGSRKR